MAVEGRSLTAKHIPERGIVRSEEGRLIGLSGAGPKAAQEMAGRLAAQGATTLVSWGCAGALAEGLQPGDLVIPDQILGTDGVLLDTDAAWRNRLVPLLAMTTPTHQGLLAESAGIVATKADKQSLHTATGAIALDMESAATARTAKDLGLPFLAVRSIVDPVEVNIPPSVQEAFDENGLLHVPKMLLRASTRPLDLVGIIRLGRHFEIAMKTLRRVSSVARANQFAIP